MRPPGPQVGLACVAVLLVLTGCSHYGFSPAVRAGGPRTVAVPVLANETIEYGAEEGVTSAIIAALTENNAMRVVPESEAEAIVRGSVTLYERPVLSYDAAGNPREYRVRVAASLSYDDRRSGTTIWSGTVEGWGVYALSGEGGGLTTEEQARAAAFEMLSEELLSKTVQGW
ncbi:MAG: LptE family protein [Candidatus Eisenbacteria bacterium]|nr:LptE family protein [Candidatus Eisenbacteria bacterium]